MTKKISSKKNCSKDDVDRNPIKGNEKLNNAVKNTYQILKQEIDLLTYEDSIERLDALIVELKKENISIDKLEDYYMKGKIYLQHCESILNDVEQSLIQIDPESLKD